MERYSLDLSERDKAAVRCTCRRLARSTLLHDNPVSPFNAIAHRRYKGFGARSTARKSSHDSPGHQLLFHLSWPYLDSTARAALLLTDPIMADYARLRRDAFVHRPTVREALLTPRPPLDLVPHLCHFRSWFMGAALLAFDFDYGDLVRWLEGEYTNRDRDWPELHRHMDRAAQHPQRPGYPKLEFAMAKEAFAQGVPLEGRYSSDRAEVQRRLQYDNHAPLNAVLPDVRRQFAKEEARSFHIALPRFIAYFIDGLMVAPLSWVIRKGKGRLVVDASVRLHLDDTGAVNDNIPRPGEPGRERENPAVYFGRALLRHLIAVWRLRQDHPTEDILQHTDDIDSAFRRMLYHPDSAIAFAYAFMEFLMIPVGEIFGARNAPSWWCLPAEIRAHMGSVLDYTGVDLPLADQVTLEPATTTAARAQFVPAVPDALHDGVPAEHASRQHLSMFVDDDVCVAIRPRMRDALRCAVGSAYQCFGHPDDDRRGSCLVDEKFPMTATARVLFVGYIIDTQLLRVEWPEAKVQVLHGMLTQWLATRLSAQASKSPVQIAKLLGYIRDGAFLCPMGNFLSIRLQWVLNEAIQRDGFAATEKKGWWKFRRVHIPASVFEDLRLLLKSAWPQPNGDSHAWARPIGLLIPREPTGEVISDAAYTGLGGWSSGYDFVWRVTRADLVEHGFPMVDIGPDGEDKLRWLTAAELPDGHDEKLHINPLEFIGIIINCWFAILAVRKDPGKPGGHIVRVRADNTSALSWLKYAARSQRRIVRNLAYFLHGLILYSQTAEYANFNGLHLPGVENPEADAVSRPELYPSLASAIKAFSRLQTCQPYLVPSGLLSTIARWISLTEIGAQRDAEMTNLLNLVPTPSSAGALDTPLASGVSKRSRRRPPS